MLGLGTGGRVEGFSGLGVIFGHVRPWDLLDKGISTRFGGYMRRYKYTLNPRP